MSGNCNLHKAKLAKNDEFYTQLPDIENELKHYKKHFKDAVIFCNCDDPEYSNFWKYFYLNFGVLGLKKLVSTHFDREKPTYKMEYDGTGEPVITPLEGNGDFHSAECIELLKEADIVITNPPFSLFRSYVAQLMDYDKKFLIIGNMNAVTYKEFFPLLKDNKVWLGCCSGSKEYMTSDDYAERYPKKVYRKNGKWYTKLGNTCWFTNLDHAQRHEPLILYKTYKGHEEEYPRYDNYAAINVDRTVDIPKDYIEDMGVPISYLGQHCPEQFEIKKFRKGNDGKDLTYSYDDGKILTDRQTDRQTQNHALLQNHHPAEDVTESWESQSHSLTSTAQNNSKSSDSTDMFPTIQDMGIDLQLEDSRPMQEYSLREKCNGVMGVPISFMDKYCPEQFEIVGISGDLAYPVTLSNGKKGSGRFYINGKRLYDRIVIRYTDDWIKHHPER